MGVFVAVLQKRRAAIGSGEQIFRAALSCRTTEAVGDYLLVDLTTRREFARIARYPRWTESGLTLFGRLLHRTDSPVLSQSAARHLRVALQVGPRPTLVIEAEVLEVKCDSGWINASLLSPFGIGRQITVDVPRPLSVRQAILTALAAALEWGGALPPLPAALTEVPMRRRPDGEEYVLLSDVPALTRHCLHRHFGVSPEALHVDAALWLAFMHRLAPGLNQRRASANGA
ncbi:hypothetical protein GCM10027034_37440 [Ramlibacter solisilvae]|uniref:Uncharacterized protein n=1 Tax=Ramlibacter tataouinensis TaxID=94132 RepID=A0A127JUU0_9BURK|nr:hypothetical protein [Ramlibacter tataouinensis]AMO23675.1 hypothetical protein UC35_13290 [Ramlibacter tataouinensis]